MWMLVCLFEILTVQEYNIGSFNDVRLINGNNSPEMQAALLQRDIARGKITVEIVVKVRWVPCSPVSVSPPLSTPARTLHPVRVRCSPRADRHVHALI